jgi:N-acetylneuraminate synthase
MAKTFIIAEAGVNHNGSLDMAFELIDAAVEAGADAIKFQTFKAENLVTKNAKQAEYQTKNMGEMMSQYQMLKNLELDYQGFDDLQGYCMRKNILFMSTPFDFESVDFLIDDLKLKTIKISSGDITNAPMLFQIAKKKVKVIISTGMATIEEIHDALAFLAYGYAQKKDISLTNVRSFYQTEEAKTILHNQVYILHCTTEYPAPVSDIHLLAMDYLRDTFGLRVGLSDHSEGILIPIAAAARGSEIIEKHFTLDKTLPGPDHIASLEPQELKNMIDSIRVVKKSLGQYEKKPSEKELKNKSVARKSIVVSKKIKKGEVFTEDHLTIKRPGTGIEPSRYWDYIGVQAAEDYDEDELLRQ